LAAERILRPVTARALQAGFNRMAEGLRKRERIPGRAERTGVAVPRG
jgi:hypothetical protein